MSRSIAVLLTLVIASLASAEAHAQPLIIERHMIAQGSVGKPGREHAYLVITNDDATVAPVTVKITRDDGALFVKDYTAVAEGRTTLEIAAEFPGLGASAFYSLAAYVGDGADGLPVAVVVELVWHRASDDAEVDSQVAAVRRSPKR